MHKSKAQLIVTTLCHCAFLFKESFLKYKQLAAAPLGEAMNFKNGMKPNQGLNLDYEIA